MHHSQFLVICQCFLEILASQKLIVVPQQYLGDIPHFRCLLNNFNAGISIRYQGRSIIVTSEEMHPPILECWFYKLVEGHSGSPIFLHSYSSHYECIHWVNFQSDMPSNTSGQAHLM